MKVDREAYLKLKIFCQEITGRPRRMEDQPSERSGAFLWCEDWEMIEILKYLFLGHETYMSEAPPRRLRVNPLWAKEQIAAKAEELVTVLGSADKIIEHLKEKRLGNAPRL